MTPDEFNALLGRIVEALRRDPSITADVVTPASNSGESPEIGVVVGGVDVILVVEPA